MSERPLRDAVEDLTEEIPEGPLGAVGRGNIAGAAGFIAVESGEVIAIPIPGVDRPGFQFVSHGMEQTDESTQEHNIVVHAISKDVAEFATQYKAAPSNLDFLRGRTVIQSIELLDEDRFYNTYDVTVRIDRDAARETVTD